MKIQCIFPFEIGTPVNPPPEQRSSLQTNAARSAKTFSPFISNHLYNSRVVRHHLERGNSELGLLVVRHHPERGNLAPTQMAREGRYSQDRLQGEIRTYDVRKSKYLPYQLSSHQVGKTKLFLFMLMLQ